MSSVRSAFGLRLAAWYASLFVVSAAAVVLLTYYLTATSLAERDHQILRSKVGEYAAAYARGGIPVLARTVRDEQAVAPERLFVRVIDRGLDALVLSDPEGWDRTRLEVESVQLGDGTLVQVGRSTELRDDLLAQFRATLGLVVLAIVAVAVGGGWLMTQSALRPIGELTGAVQSIIRTGRPDARVPVDAAAGQEDALGELSRLFNTMLDRIEQVASAMRGALDNVSHDLRTPLTRLRGTAEMALAGPPDADRDREALACVEESDRVLVMLNTLMDISEAESGTMQLQREPVDLAAVATRAVDLYKEVADAGGVELTFDRPGEEILVSGDRARLEQVAANLVDNAVKYTPGGGRVVVSLARNGTATIAVRDTGVGIPADELPMVWDRLFRGDRSRAQRGLGLGLSLVKAIVEAHGGTVAVESEAGRGSRFTVSLPPA
jgi:signal transduction histidine kinase